MSDAKSSVYIALATIQVSRKRYVANDVVPDLSVDAAADLIARGLVKEEITTASVPATTSSHAAPPVANDMLDADLKRLGLALQLGASPFDCNLMEAYVRQAAAAGEGHERETAIAVFGTIEQAAAVAERINTALAAAESEDEGPDAGEAAEEIAEDLDDLVDDESDEGEENDQGQQASAADGQTGADVITIGDKVDPTLSDHADNALSLKPRKVLAFVSACQDRPLLDEMRVRERHAANRANIVTAIDEKVTALHRELPPGGAAPVAGA